MGISIIGAALLLASDPVDPDILPPVVPVAAAVTEPVSPAPGTAPVTPALSPLPTDVTDILVTARPPPPKEDPLQAVNALSFKAVEAVDTAVIGPVAHAYKRILPEPVRDGLHNFLLNLREPEVFLNFLLQHRIGKALSTLGRFTINSTMGAAGLFDIARRRPFRLRYRYNGFANTLGFYGVKSGPFLFLPIIGATSVRDLLGYSVDKLLLPVSVGKPFNRAAYTLPSGALSALDHRTATDADIRKMNEAPDPYAAMRAAYLKSRQDEIDALHDKPVGRTKVTPRRKNQ